MRILFVALMALGLISGAHAQPVEATLYDAVYVSTTPVTSSAITLPRGASKILIDVEILDGDTGTTHNTTFTPVWGLYSSGNLGGVATRLAPDTQTVTHSEIASNPHDFLINIETVPFMAEKLYLVTDSAGAHVINAKAYAK